MAAGHQHGLGAGGASPGAAEVRPPVQELTQAYSAIGAGNRRSAAIAHARAGSTPAWQNLQDAVAIWRTNAFEHGARVRSAGGDSSDETPIEDGLI
jgi:hypothetical protein